MKKLFVGILAAVCCLAFTVPVMAEVTLGGMVVQELTYLDRSAERQVAGGLRTDVPTTNYYDGFSDFNFALPVPYNRLNAKYVSDDKKIDAFIELRGGGLMSAVVSPDAGAPGNTTGFEWNYAYISWRPVTNWLLRFGKQTTTFSPYVPDQIMGSHVGTTLGVGFGNVNHTTARSGIKSVYKFTDMVSWEFSTWDNHLVTPNAGIGGLALRGDTNIIAFQNAAYAPAWETSIPRFDMSLPITVGSFRIEPSFTWSKVEYDQVRAGDDDNFDIWGLSLGGRAAFGPFTATAEITWGENLGAGSYRGGEQSRPMVYATTTGSQAIEDSETLAWFISLNFKLTDTISISGYYGWQKNECDGSPAALDAAEYDNQRWMLGMRLPIKISKAFTIAPEITYYDFDSSANNNSTYTTNGAQRYDYGNDLVIGVRFELEF